MPDNYVSIVVKANDQTTIDFAELKARLDEIGRKVATAKVDVNDKAAVARLTAMNVRLERLNRKVTPEIDVAGALRAEAQIAAIGASLDHLGDKSASAGGGGILQKLLFGANSGMAAIGGIGTTLINPITAAVAALAAVMAGPLIASLGLVAAGFAAFGAGAAAEISKVMTAHQKLLAAQQAYAKATTAAGKASALRAEQQATDGLTGSEKNLLTLMGQLSKEFGKLVKAVQPEVIRAFGSAIKILKDLMPSLIPLAIAAGKAIDGFLKNIDSWLKSDSGRKFLKWMRTDGPDAIRTFGHVMWDVAQVVGQVFSFLRNAGNHWWTQFDIAVRNVRGAWSALARFFAQTVPAAFDLAVTEIKLAFDNLVIAADRTALAITTTMGHLPGALGAPFRKASALIRANLAEAQGAAARASAAIQGYLDAIHGKTVTIAFVTTGLGQPGGGGSGLRPGVGKPRPVAGAMDPVGGGLASSVMAAFSAAASAFATPLARPHRAPYYGPRHITNEFVPAAGWPAPPRPVRITNGAELIAVLADLLREHSRTHYGGSAQRAYGYGPG